MYHSLSSTSSRFHFLFAPFPSPFLFLFSYISLSLFFFFFFNDTATTEIYTLSLHDALPISSLGRGHAATLIDSRADFPDQPRVLGVIVADRRGKFPGRGDPGFHSARVVQVLADPGFLEDAVHLGAQPRQNSLRGARRREQAVPLRHLEIRVGFGDGRHLGQQARALRPGVREHAQAPGLDLRRGGSPDIIAATSADTVAAGARGAPLYGICA